MNKFEFVQKYRVVPRLQSERSRISLLYALAETDPRFEGIIGNVNCSAEAASFVIDVVQYWTRRNLDIGELDRMLSPVVNELNPYRAEIDTLKRLLQS